MIILVGVSQFLMMVKHWQCQLALTMQTVRAPAVYRSIRLTLVIIGCSLETTFMVKIHVINQATLFLFLLTAGLSQLVPIMRWMVPVIEEVTYGFSNSIVQTSGFN